MGHTDSLTSFSMKDQTLVVSVLPPAIAELISTTVLISQDRTKLAFDVMQSDSSISVSQPNSGICNQTTNGTSDLGPTTTAMLT